MKYIEEAFDQLMDQYAFNVGWKNKITKAATEWKMNNYLHMNQTTFSLCAISLLSWTYYGIMYYGAILL